MDWKAPPVDPAKNWINKSLELQINLSCNWSCVSCDSFSQFPVAFTKRGTITWEQIELFIREMQQANAYIGRIRILGGEPTINKAFPEIVERLHCELVPEFVGRLEVITNGTHNDRILPVKQFLGKVRISDDNDKQKHHTANLIHSPASLGYEGKICSSPWHCGISLNHWGYFPCSSGAGLARFRNDVPRWQRLALPLSTTWKPGQKPTAVRDHWPDLQSLCNHCYHGLRDEHKIKSGTSDPLRNQPSDENQQLLDDWLAGKQPDWNIYGASA